MLINTPGLSNVAQLVPNLKPLKLQLCLICQNVKDSACSSKLTSTETGRQTIISTSRKLEDGLIRNIDQNRLVDRRYHVKSCYTTYKKKQSTKRSCLAQVTWFEQDAKLKQQKESLKNPIVYH